MIWWYIVVFWGFFGWVLATYQAYKRQQVINLIRDVLGEPKEEGTTDGNS